MYHSKQNTLATSYHLEVETLPVMTTTGSGKSFSVDIENLPYGWRSNPMVNRLIELLITLTVDVPNELYGLDVVFSDKRAEDPRFFYHQLMSSLINSISRVEEGVILDRHADNPLKWIKHSLVEQNRFRTSLDELRDKKVLLSYSGGKESELIKHWLEHEAVEFDIVGIFDKFQATNLEDLDKREHEHINLGFVDYNVFFSDEQMKTLYQTERFNSFGTPTYCWMVPIQRLIVAIYAAAHGYDHVMFGDEGERAQTYRIGYTEVGGEFFVPHSWLQSQYHYNILNSLINRPDEPQMTMFTPLTNVFQPQILAWAARQNVPLNSCWRVDGEWCGECGKCVRVATIFRHFEEYEGVSIDHSTYPGLKIKEAPLLGVADREALLGLFSERKMEGVGVMVRPLNLELDRHLKTADLFDPSAHATRYSYPLTDVWDEESHTRLLDYMDMPPLDQLEDAIEAIAEADGVDPEQVGVAPHEPDLEYVEAEDREGHPVLVVEATPEQLDEIARVAKESHQDSASSLSSVLADQTDGLITMNDGHVKVEGTLTAETLAGSAVIATRTEGTLEDWTPTRHVTHEDVGSLASRPDNQDRPVGKSRDVDVRAAMRGEPIPAPLSPSAFIDPDTVVSTHDRKFETSHMPGTIGYASDYHEFMTEPKPGETESEKGTREYYAGVSDDGLPSD